MQTIRRGVLKIREFCIQHSAVLFFACMAVLAFTGGMQRIFNVEFSPTNGDFQSYNVFRPLWTVNGLLWTLPIILAWDR